MNKKKTTSASTYLDNKYGIRGSKKREEFRDEAFSYYFGEILKARRNELKLSQEDLAKKVGKKRPYISRIENGEDLRMSNFILIATALGLNIELTAA